MSGKPAYITMNCADILRKDWEAQVWMRTCTKTERQKFLTMTGIIPPVVLSYQRV